MGLCLRSGVIALSAALLLSSCEAPPDDGWPKDGITKGAQCSRTEISGMFQSRQYPVVDEGNGRVGLLYTGGADLIEPDVPYGFYRLHNCRTGEGQRLDAYHMRETRHRGVDVGLQEFIAAIRAEGLMSKPDQMRKAARAAGFEASKYGSNSQPIDDYARCGCAEFYPDIPMPDAASGAAQ